MRLTLEFSCFDSFGFYAGWRNKNVPNFRTVLCNRVIKTRKGGNYSDVLPIKAARRDSIST